MLRAVQQSIQVGDLFLLATLFFGRSVYMTIKSVKCSGNLGQIIEIDVILNAFHKISNAFIKLFFPSMLSMGEELGWAEPQNWKLWKLHKLLCRQMRCYWNTSKVNFVLIITIIFVAMVNTSYQLTPLGVTSTTVLLLWTSGSASTFTFGSTFELVFLFNLFVQRISIIVLLQTYTPVLHLYTSLQDSIVKHKTQHKQTTRTNPKHWSHVCFTSN